MMEQLFLISKWRLANKLKDAPNGKPLYAAFVFLDEK
jgi:hypothetical protein